MPRLNLSFTVMLALVASVTEFGAAIDTGAIVLSSDEKDMSEWRPDGTGKRNNSIDVQQCSWRDV